MKDVYNANLGLVERLKTDENLKLDVYKTIFGIKDLKQEYIYSHKNIRNINSFEVERYTQKINPADYNWRWSAELGEVWDSGEQSELKSHIDYMIVIRNSGEKDYVKISELADYFSDNLTYSNAGYRDVEISSYAYLKWEGTEENKNQVIQKIDKIEWKTTTKYGYTNPNMKGYNSIYTTDLETFKLEKGQFIELHIILEVNKDEKGIILNQNFENYSEIMGYKTYYKADGSIAGLIDQDSNPGNMKPSVVNKQDDEDKAPNMIFELDEIDIIDQNGETNPDGDNKPNGGNGAGKNYGNVIEGNVWEDLRKGENAKTLKLLNNQVISDGIMQEDEIKINNIKVELIEIYTKKDGTQIEKVVQTQRTSDIYSINKNGKQGGGYSFANLTAGKYKVRFTFGDYEQILIDAKYNGQDYKAVYTPDIYGNEYLDDFSSVEIMLSIDISKSMAGEPLQQEKTALIKLVNSLTEKLPKVKIGLVAFSNTATTLQKATDNKQLVINKINSIQIQ